MVLGRPVQYSLYDLNHVTAPCITPLTSETAPLLASQAEARQQAWVSTAAGKAALKSEKAVREERAHAYDNRPGSKDTAKDWLS